MILTAVLVVFALITNGVLAEMPRFGAGLHGGRLLPAADLTTTWSDYLASWHPVNGGTGAPAPVSLLVLALLGTVLAPFGGPSAVLTVVMLFGVPLAGLSAYIASRGLPVPWAKARVLTTRIRRNIKLAECPSYGQSVLAYAPKCPGAADYLSLAREVLGQPAAVAKPVAA